MTSVEVSKYIFSLKMSLILFWPIKDFDFKKMKSVARKNANGLTG